MRTTKTRSAPKKPKFTGLRPEQPGETQAHEGPRTPARRTHADDRGLDRVQPTVTPRRGHGRADLSSEKRSSGRSIPADSRRARARSR